jgi:hypothetical protein
VTEEGRPTGDVPPDDLVPEDDAVIGRALRLSLFAIIALGAVVLAVVLLRQEPVAAERVVPKQIGEIPNLVTDTERMPEVRFTDVTTASGIDFVHTNGARGEKLLPETMGSGAAFFDADGDGAIDLLLMNATYWPGESAGRPEPTPALYRNDGAGRFRDVTAAAGLARPLYGTGAATGDIDGDGDADLFLAALGPNRLYRNDGGRFTDITASAGVAGAADAWSTSAGFLDYDNDGDLDLFVCNYVRWSREIDIELHFTLNGRDRAYGPPTNYEGAHSYLYRNEGGGRFTDVSAAAGIEVPNPHTGRPAGKALGVTFADLDRDGFIDIVVANDTVQNFLFRNRGDGTFEEVGAVAGVGFDAAGNATGAMGIDLGYHRNDDLLAIGITNFANEMTSLYVGRAGELRYTDDAISEGIGAPTRELLKFGLLFLDYDLDGRLDLLQANGHLENEIAEVQASQTYRQRAQLFWNAGPDARACFAEVPSATLGDLPRPIVGRGAAYADLDRDGDLDVLLTQVADRPLLLRNEQALGRHWLRVRAVGRTVNGDAIGTWIEVTAAGVVQRRQVMPTRSYLSQVELPVTFGLGGADRVDRIRVEWPDGTSEELSPSAVDAEIEIVQGSHALP